MQRNIQATQMRLQSNARQTVRVLLVEDCPSDVVLFEHILQEASLNWDYVFTDVPRLVDAFSLIDKQTFDIIILDLNLIDINGIASVVALHAEARHTPIIVYSGTDDPKLKEKSLMCGAAHYLVKGRESGYGLKHIIERTLTARAESEMHPVERPAGV